MDVTQILLNARSENKAIREQAEQTLRNAEQTNFPLFCHTLAVELANETKDSNSRRLAGVILKNSLSPKTENESIKQQAAQRWLSMIPNMRNQIKQIILPTLGSSFRDARHIAAQVISKIAGIETPSGEWPELIPSLLNNVTGQTGSVNIFLKQATLETFGFICEEVDPAVIQHQSNQILTAVIEGMKKESGNIDIILAATNALCNALEFVQTNFQQKVERDYIMTVVCEATQIQDTKVRNAAFECLAKIATLYYDVIDQYMQSIFTITLLAIKNDVTEVQLQAIEFWSTVAEEELNIIDEIKKPEKNKEQPNKVFHSFTLGALNFLVPELLVCLTKQEDDQDEDAWNAATAAATCLGLIANTVGYEVVRYVMPWIEEHIQSSDWRSIEAALMAFGSILEGPETEHIATIIVSALPVILMHLKNKTVLVRDTTAWTIGRICQFHIKAIEHQLLLVIQSLTAALTDEETRVASHACWAIHSIAQPLITSPDPPTSVLTQFFQPLLQVLLNVTEREDATESNLRCSAYELINVLIQAAAKDCYPTIRELIPLFTNRLEQTFSFQIMTQEDKENQIEQQALLCSVLQIIIRKLEGDIKPFADKMMSLFLGVFATKSSTVHEDALMAVGALANAIEGEFVRYLQSDLMKYLYGGLSNWEAHSVCSVAVGVVGDICRAIGDKIAPYCDEIINLLLQNLRHASLNRDVKPPILSCFGDIAFAIGGHFDKYLPIVMEVLNQASQTTVDQDDFELVEYLDNLREGIFEAYTGILHGLRSDNKAILFMPYVDPCLSYIENVWGDENRSDKVTQGVVGVLGDIAQTLEGNVKSQLNRNSIRRILNEAMNSENTPIQSLAHWAHSTIFK